MQIPADFTKTLDYTSSLVDNGINGHLAQTHEAILEDSKGTQTLRQYKLYSDVMNTKIENIVSYMINTTTLHSF